MDSRFTADPKSILMEVKEYPTLRYCEFHEQNRHTTAKCRELRKALHEHTNKGQIDRFFERGP